MRPHVVEHVGRMYQYTPIIGKEPVSRVEVGSLFVRIAKIGGWHSWSVSRVDEVTDREVLVGTTYRASMAENGLVMLGEPNTKPLRPVYSWGRNNYAWIVPIDSCMFSMTGTRRNLLAQRHGSRARDLSSSHLFVHKEGSYRTLCHINTSAGGYGQFLKLDRNVSCSYCMRKMNNGEVDASQFMRV